MMEPEEDPEPREETGEPHTNNASRAAPSVSSAVGGGRRGYQSVENPVLIAGNASSSTNLCMKILTACTIALVLDVLLLSLYIHRKDPPSGRGDNGWLFSESRDTDWTETSERPLGSLRWKPVPSSDQVMTKVAFGSCASQKMPQPYWDTVVRYQPDVLLLMGDNVYGDCHNTSCVELREAYRVFESLPSVRGAAPQLATLATLDDHDYGQDDCHGDNPYKEIARGLFQQVFHHLGELPVNGGVYRAWSFGPSGQRLQVILLDTRYGRSPFDLHADNDSGTSGLHQPTDREEQHMLSDYQWDWLGAQLEEPADLRLIVSSIQVLNEVTRYECWRHLPRERERLFQLLEGFGSDLILLSGDRHMGGFYQTNGTNSTLTEVTASAWTHSFPLAAEGDAACTALLCDEMDPSRLDDLVHENNWGTLEIDWELRTYQLALRRSDTTYGVSYLNPEYHKGTDAGAILQSYDFNF